jgi:hypothetical protein
MTAHIENAQTRSLAVQCCMAGAMIISIPTSILTHPPSPSRAGRPTTKSPLPPGRVRQIARSHLRTSTRKAFTDTPVRSQQILSTQGRKGYRQRANGDLERVEGSPAQPLPYCYLFSQRSPTIVGESPRSRKKKRELFAFCYGVTLCEETEITLKAEPGEKVFARILIFQTSVKKGTDYCPCDFLPMEEGRGSSWRKWESIRPGMWISSNNAECGLPQCVRIAERCRLCKLLVLVLLFFPFLCRIGIVSRSRLLLFGGASDDEYGSKEGYQRRGKFHRMALAKFCCKLRKSQ